jgi:hypothetical protein
MRTALFRSAEASAAPNGHAGSASAAAGADATSASATRLAALAPRRRPVLWMLSISLVASGALLAVDAARSAGHKSAVLVAARDVGAGEQITPADVAVVHVSTDPGLPTVPAGDQPSVAGSVAAVDLKAGSLLTRSELTGTATPTAGTVLVGLALKAGQLPARELTRGDRVLIVATPGQPDPASPAQPGRPVTYGAVVADSAPTGAGDGSTVVDVVAAQNTAPALAADVAGGHIAVLLLPRR